MLGFRKKRNERNNDYDDDYIVKLYQLYSKVVEKTIVSKLYSRSIEDIEDCVQEVFVVAVKRIDELREHPKLIGWFTVVAKNIAMKKNEKFLKEKCVNDEALEDCPDSFQLDEHVVEDILFTELVEKDVVSRVFSELEVEEKKLYKLRWIEHLSYAEIENRLNLSESAVKNRILRLKQRIKDTLKIYVS